MFRHNIKQLTKANNLSNYGICYDVEADMVIFNNHNLTSEQKEKSNNGKKENGDL